MPCGTRVKHTNLTKSEASQVADSTANDYSEGNAINRAMAKDNRLMGIRIEFFGVARQRTGTASVIMPVEGTVALGVLLARLAEQFPSWAAECLDGDRIRPSHIINVDGHRFVHDPREPIGDNASLLIMSADAGG